MLKNLPKNEKIVFIILALFCVGFLITSIFLYTERNKEIRLKVQFKGELERTVGLKNLLETELKDLKLVKEDLEVKLDESKKRADSLGGELEREKKMREALLSELNKSKQDAESLKRQFQTEKDDKLKMQDRLTKLNKDKDDLSKQLSDLNQAKQGLEERLKKIMGQPQEGIKLERIVVKPGEARQPGEPVQGEVLVVNRDFNFVVVNLGKNDGLKIGSELTIYKGNDAVGKAKVEKLYNNMSAAGIAEGAKKEQIQEGAIVKF